MDTSNLWDDFECMHVLLASTITTVASDVSAFISAKNRLPSQVTWFYLCNSMDVSLRR